MQSFIAMLKYVNCSWDVSTYIPTNSTASFAVMRFHGKWNKWNKMKQIKQLTIYKCSLCFEPLNNYKRARAMNIILKGTNENFTSELVCRSCIKKYFLQYKECGKIMFDLRPFLQYGILTCNNCKQVEIPKPENTNKLTWNDWEKERERLKNLMETKPKTKKSNTVLATEEKCCKD